MKNDFIKALSFVAFLTLVFFIILIFAEDNVLVGKIASIFGAISLFLAIAISLWTEYKYEKTKRINALNILFNGLVISYNDLAIYRKSELLRGSLAVKFASGTFRKDPAFFLESPDNFLFQESLITLIRTDDVLRSTIQNYDTDEEFYSLAKNIFLFTNEIVANFENLRKSMEEKRDKLTDKQANVLRGYQISIDNNISPQFVTLQKLLLQSKSDPLLTIKYN